MEGFPVALVVASRQDVVQNNNVLFRLVRPMGSDLQSVNKMVNVVPYRRVYVFERPHEIDDFRQEMLKRPLVLQPILHFGRGIGSCGACYNDEQWVIMINQTHPKILSRLQMGLDMAKSAIEKGQSIELKFRFGKMVERIYKEHLKQKERAEAKTNYETLLAGLRFAEWEHGDLTIRFHGYAARLGRKTTRALENAKMNWLFEDIGMHEMLWNQLEGQTFSKPHCAPVSEDEIRVLLPSWTINSVSPLEAMGDEIPQHTYSYAQAGRLYESFRKKKRQRDKVAANTPSEFDHAEEKLEGATGGFLPPYPASEYAVEYEFGEAAAHDKKPKPWRGHQNKADPYYTREDHYDTVRERSYSRDSYEDDVDDYHHEEHFMGQHYRNVHEQNERQFATAHPSKHASEQKARVQVDVHVPVSASSRNTNFSQQSIAANHDLYTLSNLKKQDSDRSSHSTNADSGYHADGEGLRSRGGSYDLNEEQHSQTTEPVQLGYDKMPLKTYQNIHEGVENPAFQIDASDDALKRHKELVLKVLHNPNSKTSHSNDQYRNDKGYPASPTSVVRKSAQKQVADTFI